ncbi:MAG TPA: dephospho-CoA kinase [Candidatus Limnocylindria bacterium]|nr:dephospho-CoA kinase [Candidatus Limnocylindria bacterium]
MSGSRRPLVIGLTGPIGCGKSTIARMLGELGGVVIDADQLARAATEPAAAGGRETMAAIRHRFGAGVATADGTLDRAALAAIVFSDPAALADLERIVHPRVRAEVERRLATAEDAGELFVAIEAIKLVEGGLAARCDEVWLIDCPPAVQRRRLAERGDAPDDVERRLTAQGNELAGRLAASLAGSPTAVRRIGTDGSLEATRRQVEDTLAAALEPLTVGDPGAG